MTGPGYPNDTRLKIQSLAQFLTSRTTLLAVIDGPEAILRESFCPVASSLIFVPPTSMTRTFGAFPGTLFISVLTCVREAIITPPHTPPFSNEKRITQSTAKRVRCMI